VGLDWSGRLLVGLELGKSLAYAIGKPVVGVNHLRGHLAAVYLEHAKNPSPPPFPHVALLVSGGNTTLFRVEGKAKTVLLGSTRDDAAGEAFDKVAKLLGLGYPGGMVIDRLAATGNPDGDPFSARLARSRGSRLLLFRAQDRRGHAHWQRGTAARKAQLPDFCASFQAAVVDVLVRKARRALAREGLRDLVVCGGVAANRGLRQALASAAAEDGFSLYIPSAHALHRQRGHDRARRHLGHRTRRTRRARSERGSRIALVMSDASKAAISTGHGARAARPHGLSPKKSLGQNFLVDPRVQERIVAAAEIQATDVVVEIGAGWARSPPVSPTSRSRVIAIDRDAQLVPVLRTELADRPNLEIVLGDALEFDLGEAARKAGRPLVVVGNLPYVVTSPVLFATIEAAAGGQVVDRAIFMVQKEFAQRMLAPPGSRTYGRLSVMVQQAASAEILVSRGRGCVLATAGRDLDGPASAAARAAAGRGTRCRSFRARGARGLRGPAQDAPSRA
jgi:glycoprotease/Kae1 family metallohydrolase